MAISRAQLLKELLPGLNALFGLEYAKYGEEHAEIFESESSDRSFKKKLNYQASLPHQSKTKVLPSNMTLHKKHSPLATHTKQWRWAFQ
jgi:hypothetical protein